MARSIPFEKHHREFLRDPEKARAYLEVALEEYEKDRNSETFLLALRDVAEARGGLEKRSEQTKLSHIDQALSSKENPRLDTIGKILHSLGFRLSIEPLNAEQTG